MNPVELYQGSSPIILSMPHTGTYIPETMLQSLNDTGHELADTDWHIHQLYQDLLPNVTTVRATFHRYVIDANRSAADENLYPGQNTTGLCPVTDFSGKAIYREGCEPGSDEINQRIIDFHQPYHQALEQEIQRIYQQHGMVILYDCHSIRSQLPFLFEGILPDFNIGTNDGASCDPAIVNAVYQQCAQAEAYSTVLNGRFKGGWTTRHYGQPQKNIHAIQMELAQKNYMEEMPPWNYLDKQAQQIRSHLQRVLKSLENLASIE